MLIIVMILAIINIMIERWLNISNVAPKAKNKAANIINFPFNLTFSLSLFNDSFPNQT